MRLSIRTARWRAHVAQVAASTPGLVPVVKGNGYGFGREWLAEVAAEFAATIAVGTIHELDGLPAAVTPVVLTPTLMAPISTDAVLTIGNEAHVAALDGWNGRVVIKLASGMRRFGGTAALVDAARAGARGRASSTTALCARASASVSLARQAASAISPYSSPARSLPPRTSRATSSSTPSAAMCSRAPSARLLELSRSRRKLTARGTSSSSRAERSVSSSRTWPTPAN